MIHRRITEELEKRLNEVPAVVLLGPRQSGKTTLALEIAKNRTSLYLDLESEQDRAKLAEPEFYLGMHSDKLVILDEIHRAPDLFPILRGLIDKSRRKGKRAGLYLLLGSAALELLKQSGETLAGRVSYMELDPLNVVETGESCPSNLWLRGGFPDSYLASNDSASLRWRRDFIRSYLERDIPQFGPRIPAERLRRFWTMLAHNQGGLLNRASLAQNMGVDTKTASRYIDLLVDLLLVRRLQPWFTNTRKRMVKAPRVYVRDSGLVHALLSIDNMDSLLSHPVLGMSWEGFVIEQLLSVSPDCVDAFFYRTSAGAEIDLVLVFASGSKWAVEIKRSGSPKPAKGFHFACADLCPDRKYIVYPGNESFPLKDQVQVVSLKSLCRELLNNSSNSSM
ncbi:MAG: ATP-binding protein [Candidatus Sabulitectum sp.]|nr:ATP-binding protein [Candidatus Sabulitectum sp.]